MQTGRVGEQAFPANADFKLRVHTQAPFCHRQFSGQLIQRLVFGSTNCPSPQEQTERPAFQEAPAAQETQIFLFALQCFPSVQLLLFAGLLDWDGDGCGAIAGGVFCGSVVCWPGQVSF